METIELQAKSVEEAKDLAAEKLGVSRDEIEITLLEETKGLFGKSNVKVQATRKAAEAKEAAPAEKKAAEPAPEKKARGRKAEPKKKEPEVSAEKEQETAEATEEVIATDEDAKKVSQLINEILEIANLDANVHPTGLTGKYVNLELDGKDVAYLVGNHGEVLNAFQYLLNVIVNKQIESGIRITLEGNNFRRRREEALTQLALQIADQVKQRGEEAVLDALPAFERRIVHKSLQSQEGVTTYSEGEEPNRRVVIAPAG